MEQRHHIGVADLRAVIEELQFENLAAGTHFSENDFRLDDEYDSPATPEVTAPPLASPSDPAGSNTEINQPSEISTPENPEAVVVAEKEYLHAVGDDTVLPFDTATAGPTLDTEKKKMS